VDADKKRKRLLEISQEEVVYENDILAAVVVAPDESICDPAKESGGRKY
jgi:hypothetical protein